MPSNHFVLCHSLLLPPSIFTSIRVFSNESALHIRWPKYWSFNFSISPSNEYSGLIFFRIDRFDLLAVQGTLKSLLQHHSSKASILGCSAFFMVALFKFWQFFFSSVSQQLFFPFWFFFAQLCGVSICAYIVYYSAKFMKISVVFFWVASLFPDTYLVILVSQNFDLSLQIRQNFVPCLHSFFCTIISKMPPSRKPRQS